MIKITLSDGAIRKYRYGITPLEIANDISLGDSILCAILNGQPTYILKKIIYDSYIEFCTWEHYLGKKAFWQSSAHLLAKAILEIYPKTKFAISKPIYNGFYYDMDLEGAILSDKDFNKLEARILYHANKKLNFELYNVSKIEALDYYKDNPYKISLIKSLTEDCITFCRHANFIDLCYFVHLPNTNLVKSVKLISVSGSYWLGDKKNKQLTRVYGVSFPNDELLKKYFFNITESKKRDHRRLGKDLGLFFFSEKVGAGLPLWKPKGAMLRKSLEDFLMFIQKKSGYEFVVTPHIGSKILYKTSGHWLKYGEDSFFTISSPHGDFMLKPMNCPHHCEIYRSQSWSYKDLPKRLAEFGTVYRYEQSGELHGLTRVRCFTQDDAHIFCTHDQLLNEFKSVIDLVLYVFKSCGFKDYTLNISLRNPDTPNRYIGTEENWKKAECDIINATKNLKTKIVYGEAAFYGPKLDFLVKDSLDRNWQLGTIQIDYNLPAQFDLQYKEKDNMIHRPVMIHRAPFGSFERLIAIMIEHTAGKFPFWLAPLQIIIIPIVIKHNFYAKKILNLLSYFRVSIDARSEKTGKKIRDAEIFKIPYMIVLGDKEENSNTISVRANGHSNMGIFVIEDFLNFINSKQNIKNIYL